MDERDFILLNHLSRLKKNGESERIVKVPWKYFPIWKYTMGRKNGESERFVKVPWKYFPNRKYTMGRRKRQFNNIWEEFYGPIMNNDNKIWGEFYDMKYMI